MKKKKKKMEKKKKILTSDEPEEAGGMVDQHTDATVCTKHEKHHSCDMDGRLGWQCPWCPCAMIKLGVNAYCWLGPCSTGYSKQQLKMPNQIYKRLQSGTLLIMSGFQLEVLVCGTRGRVSKKKMASVRFNQCDLRSRL